MNEKLRPCFKRDLISLFPSIIGGLPEAIQLVTTNKRRKRERGREKDEELSNKKNKKRNVRKKSRWGMIRGGEAGG